MEEILWQLLANLVSHYRNRLDLSMNAAKAAWQMLTDVVKMISLPALFITGSVGAVRSQLTRYLSLLMATQKHPVKSRMLSLSLLSMTSRLNLRIYRSHMPYALVIPLQLRSPLRYFQSVSVMVLTRRWFQELFSFWRSFRVRRYIRSGKHLHCLWIYRYEKIHRWTTYF